MTRWFGLLVLASARFASAQSTTVPADDAAAIQALVSRYAQALFGCKAEEFADMFAPETGYFASGFRGHMVGRARLIGLVESERHCAAPAPAGTAPAARPGGNNGPTVVLEATPTGVRGTAELGGAGQYQDEYVKTPKGWRFASRTVVTGAEKAAGLEAVDMLAISKLSGPELVDNYQPDQNGVSRLKTSGVFIAVSSGAITGHAFTKDGGYDDNVYEKTGPGQWRIKSHTHVAAPAH